MRVAHDRACHHNACMVLPHQPLTVVLGMQDVTFHQCVNLGRYNTEKVVSFVPPDGEFELMKYRCQEGIKQPFRVLPVINEMGRTRLEVNVKVKSTFDAKLFALNVVVQVPMPDNTARAEVQTSQGGSCPYLCQVGFGLRNSISEDGTMRLCWP